MSSSCCCCAESADEKDLKTTDCAFEITGGVKPLTVKDAVKAQNIGSIMVRFAIIIVVLFSGGWVRD